MSNDTAPKGENVAQRRRFEALAGVSLEAKLAHRNFAPLYANRAFADMFGFDSPEEVLAQPSLIRVFDAAARADGAPDWRNSALYGRRLLHRRDGSPFRAEIYARAVDWEDGEPAIALAILDVSQEERAYRALLETRAAAEDAARRHAKLHVAAARRLHAPLSAAISQLQGQPTQPDIDQTLHACRTLMLAVETAFDTDPIGAANPPRAPFDPFQPLTEAVEAVRRVIGRERVALTLYGAEDVRLIGDQARVARIARLLIEETARRAPGAQVGVEGAVDAPGLTLQVSAYAEGAGAAPLSPEGLDVARALAEAAGGVVLTRAQGLGGWSASAFLPYPKAADQPPAPIAGPPRDVLVVDDNPGALRLARAILLNLGHRPVCVGNGAEAIASVLSQRFDLILMDINLPGMDGFETTRRIRALPRPWPSEPIAALTASNAPHMRDAAAEAGMDAFLEKPIAAARLAEAISLLTKPREALVEPAERDQIEEENQDNESADCGERGHRRLPQAV